MSASVAPYIGPWQDHANGVWTLTLPDREAGVLSAALLIFTGFVASQAWNITKFATHQLRAGRGPGTTAGGGRDGLWHQQQAAIRNSNSHLHALWYFVSLAAAWFRLLGAGRAAARSAVLVLVSLTSLVAWSAIRLFVSYSWTTAGDHFLVDSGLCGAVLPVGPNVSRISERALVWQTYYGDRMEEASTYERQCYGQGRPDPSLCGRLPVPRLAWAARDGRCPMLEDALCIKTNTTPVVMDSGFINSNNHLGVNAEPEDTVEYRKLATCAPLQTNHASYDTDESLRLGPQYEWFYGYNYALNTEATFTYPAINQIMIGSYRLVPFYYDPAPGSPLLWKPNATTMFSRTDAQMSLFFLVTDYLRYFAPVYDMWFLTDPDPVNATADSRDGPVRLWAPLLHARIVACEEVHQLCNRNLAGGQQSQCANFTLAEDTAAVAARLRLGPRQTATWLRLWVALLNSGLRDVAWMLGEPIEAGRTVLDGSQYAALPVDQWRREVGRWFGVGLALLQRGMVEFVTGPATAGGGAQKYFENVTDGRFGGLVRDDCGAQRVRGVIGARNFDIRAIIVIVVVGSGIVLAGLSVDTVVGFAQQKLATEKNQAEARRLGWILDGLFQIQRVAFEGAGVGGWKRLEANVPVTSEDPLLQSEATIQEHPPQKEGAAES